jgi:hypothetical protein
VKTAQDDAFPNVDLRFSIPAARATARGARQPSLLLGVLEQLVAVVVALQLVELQLDLGLV